MLDILDTVHVYEADLDLYCRAGLEPGHSYTVESHLRDCQGCRKQLSMRIKHQLIFSPGEWMKLNQQHKRSERRFTTGGDAIFQELDPLSFDRQKVRIVDVSKNGLGILAPKMALPGSIAQIRMNDTVELGEVRHCSMFGGSSYRIGLRLYGAL